MAQQVKFYEKNLIDVDVSGVTITVTDATATNNGQDFVDFLRNRNNDTFWATTDSNDAANTQIDIDTGELNEIDRIILVKHNFGAFTIQYWDGGAFVDFSTPINETTNTDSTTEFVFNQVQTDQIRIIITGTQVADEDKNLHQLLICKSIGQLEGYPQIRKPTISQNKSSTTLLSGKQYIATQRGSFSVDMQVRNYNIDADIDIFETIYFSLRGVLVWINAGDDAQFSRTHRGFRGEDIYLMSPRDEYRPEHYKFCYQLGIKFKVRLVEVVR